MHAHQSRELSAADAMVALISAVPSISFRPLNSTRLRLDEIPCLKVDVDGNLSTAHLSNYYCISHLDDLLGRRGEEQTNGIGGPFSATVRVSLSPLFPLRIFCCHPIYPGKAQKR